MVALQIELGCSGMAVSTALFGFVRVTSGSVLTEKVRAEETPRRDITRASQTHGAASGAMLTVNLFSTTFPSAPTTGFAVTLGEENKSALTSSIWLPVMATSNVVPACPPMGMMVSRRGSG